MSEINLFSINKEVKELSLSSVKLEKEIQTLIEENMETFFGVRFLATEYVINDGRMDSIGIDENNCPVIFEYKRSSSENIINQGLFYLDWLLDHKANFQLLVQERLGAEVAKKIDWSIPSVICIAREFTKYDEYAVNQMGRNIKLVKYSKYGNDLLLLEHINTPNIKNLKRAANQDLKENIKNKTEEKVNSENISYNLEEKTSKCSKEIREIFFSLKDFILSLGDNISENILKHYIAYKKSKNFVCVEIYKNHILLYLKLNPKEEKIIEGFSRDVTDIGSYGTGNFEIIIKSMEDYNLAKSYIEKAYLQN